MARARGSNVLGALAFESAYGVAPGSGFMQMPFVSADIGDEQGLIESDLIGQGREPLAPSRDVINNRGDIVVPLDLRFFGRWLRAMLGAPTTTQGRAATGTITFSAQPADSATITVGGQAFTFVPSAPTANQILKGATLAETVANAVRALRASAVAGVTAASYRSNLAGTAIEITHNTIGTGGNSFALTVGTSPASNATASGSTLSGGVTSGPYNHVFNSGGLTLPSVSLELGMPEVPRFAMNRGGMINTGQIQLARSGNLNAQLGAVFQAEVAAATTQTGSLTAAYELERFNQFTGYIERDGVVVGDLVSGSIQWSNNYDVVETIRPDGRIAGGDPGMFMVNGQAVVRFGDSDLMALAEADATVDLVYGWRISADKRLTIRAPRVHLPKPKASITGPGGIQQTYDWQGSKGAAGRALIVTLVNDVPSY